MGSSDRPDLSLRIYPFRYNQKMVLQVQVAGTTGRRNDRLSSVALLPPSESFMRSKDELPLFPLPLDDLAPSPNLKIVPPRRGYLVLMER